MSAADRVTAIRARLDAATPGPWEWGDRERMSRQGPTLRPVRRSFRYTDEIARVALTEGRAERFAQGSDAELIANAPADLAWLLDQLEAMEARAAAAEARLDRHRSTD